MPPIGFWASSPSSYSSATGSIIVLTPNAAQVGDALLLAIAAPTANAIVAPDGWEELDADVAGGAVLVTVYLFRHVVIDEEPAQHVFACAAAVVPQPLGIAVLLRATDLGAELVTSSSATLDPTNTNYGAPSVNLATYSDLVLAYFYAKDAAGTDAFTPPATTDQLGATVHGPGGSGGGSLALVELRKEATGATGVLLGLWAVTALGVCGQWAIKANPTLVAPAVTPDVPGAIGLPTVGV